MAEPYALLSDVHLHAWSQFSTTEADGVNSRLRITLNELERAADTLRAAGGHTLVIAGDLFHVRGEVKPSVLNPTIEVIGAIIASGINVVAIPGNHDLEFKDTNKLGNALGTLKDAGVRVIEEPTVIGLGPSRKLGLIPWMQDVRGLLAAAKKLAGIAHDLIIHAPVNGVLNIPDHGLDPKELVDLGINRVFSGHYHNHKDLGDGIYSIGATTHQNWGDVGSRAGFLIVTDDAVKWHASHAPKFIDLDPELDDAEAALAVDGNYVRVKLVDVSEAEIKTVREKLGEWGAKGVVINATKSGAVVTRTASSVKAGASLETSVFDFIRAKSYAVDQSALTSLCTDILTEAKERAE